VIDIYQERGDILVKYWRGYVKSKLLMQNLGLRLFVYWCIRKRTLACQFRL